MSFWRHSNVRRRAHGARLSFSRSLPFAGVARFDLAAAFGSFLPTRKREQEAWFPPLAGGKTRFRTALLPGWADRK